MKRPQHSSNSNSNAMKLKRNAPKGKKAAALGADTPPETPEDLMELGATHEESGDKFYGSDPAKALRFYQRAYDAYVQAQLPETYYNASRLLLHVHKRYREEAAPVAELTGVQEVFSAATPVVQDLPAIAEAHEAALRLQGEGPLDAEKSDLLFNAAIVYSELLEADAAPAGTAERGMQLLEAVAGFQAARLSAGEDVRAELVETVTAALTLAAAAVEAAEDHVTCWAALGPGVRGLVTLVGGGGVDEADGLDWADFRVARAYLAAVTEAADPEAVAAVWSDGALAETPERYMQAADSMESFLVQRGIAPRPADNGAGAGSAAVMPEQADAYWRALTEMTRWLKTAETALRARLDAARSDSQAVGTGQTIAQMAGVQIARADIDLQRSRLPRDLAASDRELLVRNCSAFLKNAMNLARSSGGLRETFVERTSRQRRRVEAVYRLCVLENKTTPAELDEILGVGKWQAEQRAVAQLWYWQ